MLPYNPKTSTNVYVFSKPDVGSSKSFVENICRASYTIQKYMGIGRIETKQQKAQNTCMQ